MHQFDLNDLEYLIERGYAPKGFVPCPRSTDGRINPQLSQFWLGGDRYASVFHVKPVYYETVDGHWRPLSEVTTHSGNHRITIKYECLDKISPDYLSWLIKRQALLRNGLVEITSPYQSGIFQLTDQLGILGAAHVSFTTTTVYPDPNTETVTFDGSICNQFSGTGGVYPNLSTVQALTTSTNFNDSSASLQDNDWGYACFYIRAPNTNHNVGRAGILFDTSSIGTDSVDSATLSIYGKTSISDGMNDAYGYIGVVSLLTNSNTGWTSSDYDIDNWGTTEYATSIDITSWSTSAYNNYTFNATGEAAINGSGVTKIGLMHGRDIQDQNWTGGNANSLVQAYAADQTGTSNDPKLVVEHTAVSTFRPRVLMY